METVLVTGGAGFVGNHLCARLAQRGVCVISLDNAFTGEINESVPGVEYRRGDTRDIAKCVPEKIDCIFHLGEYSRPEQSLEEPENVWELNIAGTFRVLEYWRARKCKLIYAGSSTKFADGGLGRDQSPYAWTKAANTELVRNYGAWYDLPYAITYFYNVYGPGEHAGKYGTVIEIFRRLHAAGKPLTVRSPGTQKRNFTHVDDIVDGLLLVAEKGEGDEFGLGNENEYSILDVAKLFGGDVEMLPERAGNRMTSVVDVTKSRAIGWEATRELEDYIRSITKS